MLRNFSFAMMKSFGKADLIEGATRHWGIGSGNGKASFIAPTGVSSRVMSLESGSLRVSKLKFEKLRLN